MYSRRSRTMSAGEVRELYGISVRQLRSSETVFRKESFKQDKQRLKVAVDAINNEMRLTEQKWDSAKSRFVRDHAKFVNAHRKKIVYEKVGTINERSAESIPPCILVAGQFSLYQHSVQNRWGSGRSREVLHRHSSFYRLSGSRDLEQTGEEWSQSQLNNNVPTNQRIPTSFSPSSTKPSGVSPRNHRPFSPKNNMLSSGPKHSIVSKSVHWKREPCEIMYNKHSHYHRTYSEPVDNRRFLNDGANGNFPTDHTKNGTENTYHHFDMNNNSGIHTNVDCFTGVDNQNTLRVTHPHQKTQNRKSSRGQTDEPADWKDIQSVPKPRDKEPMAAQRHRTKRNKKGAARKDKTGRSGENTDENNGVKPSGGDSPSGSDVSESLDVELLQRAVMDQSNEMLVRNRWHRAMERVLLLSSGASDDATAQVPEEFARGTHLSLASLTSPRAPAVEDIPDPDTEDDSTVTEKMVQTLDELDYIQFQDLTEVWPNKMDKLMTVIKDLVKNTGVEVTDIAEKVLKGDVKDKKCAALFDWLENVNNTIREQESHNNLFQHSNGQILDNSPRITMETNVIASCSGSLVEQQKVFNHRQQSQENPSVQGFQKPPLIFTGPSSRHQSKHLETCRGSQHHQMAESVQIETVTSINFSTEKTDTLHKAHSAASSYGGFTHEGDSYGQKSFGTQSNPKPAKGFRRRSFNNKMHPASGSTSNKPKLIQFDDDEFLVPDQRLRSFSYSKPHSAEAREHHFTRPRVNSTGQQRPKKTSRHDPLLVRRHMRKMSKERSLSPSSKTKRQGYPRGKNQSDLSELNKNSAAEDSADHKKLLDTTETSLYTDRMGNTHRLITRKASLSSACIREANVTVTREDPIVEQALPDEEKLTAEETTEGDSRTFPEVPANSDNVSTNSPCTPEEGTEHGSEIPRGTKPLDFFSLVCLLTQKSKDEDTQSLLSNSQDSAAPTPVEEEDPPDEDELLWRKRLSHSEDMTWAPELSSDLKGQGLALSLLYRKEGNTAKFRSTLLKVVCINMLRASNEVYDDVTFHELQKCRYLRMPFGCILGIQRELDLDEICS
ncbi:hypothetical protein ACOMHN_061372 [Nucella lapillus]